MGYDPVKSPDVNARLEKFQYILFISNILLLIIALANFSICIWIRYVVMIAMVFHALNNGISAYGTFTQSRMILLVSLVLRVFIWFLTLAGMIVICIYGVEESTTLVNELDLVFREIIERMNVDERAMRILVQIQEYVGCCGASGNSLDFINKGKPMPDSCRHPVTGNRYGYHCPQVMAWWLEPWTSTLADLVIGVITVKIRNYIRVVKEM